MTSFVYKLAIVFLLFGTTISSKFPLTRCFLNDPDLDGCMLKAARNSVGPIFKGISTFKLPPIEPMNLGDMVLSAHRGPLNLDVELINSTLEGVSNVHIDSAKFDKNQRQLVLAGIHKDIKLVARYLMKGKIFRIPVNSAGKVEIRFLNVVADHLVQFKPGSGVILHGQHKQKSIVTFALSMKSVDVMRMNLMSDNLGSFGNRALNELMNSNWRLLYAAFKTNIESWLQNVYTESMDNFFSFFNFDEMIPNSS